MPVFVHGESITQKCLHAAFGTTAPEAMLPLGACCIGFGGLSYHMAQFSAASLFPEKRGLLSSLYVAGFIMSGIVWEVERAIFASLGATVGTFRIILLVHAAVAAPMIPLMLWMAPRTAFKTGQMLMFDKSRVRFYILSPEQGKAPEAAANSNDGGESSGGLKNGEVSATADADPAAPHDSVCKLPDSGSHGPNAGRHGQEPGSTEDTAATHSSGDAAAPDKGRDMCPRYTSACTPCMKSTAWGQCRALHTRHALLFRAYYAACCCPQP
jgi:hypothetical protein